MKGEAEGKKLREESMLVFVGDAVLKGTECGMWRWWSSGVSIKVELLRPLE